MIYVIVMHWKFKFPNSVKYPNNCFKSRMCLKPDPLHIIWKCRMYFNVTRIYIDWLNATMFNLTKILLAVSLSMVDISFQPAKMDCSNVMTLTEDDRQGK